MSEVKPKPQLHQSQLAMLYRCGYQFEQIVLMGESEPASTPQIIGKTAHHVTAVSLAYKLHHKKTMSKDELSDITKDSFLENWNHSDLALDETEREQGLDQVKGKSLDKTISMAISHAKEIVGIIKPREDGIEWKWVIECTGYPYDLAGQIDVVEEDFSVGDHKFRNRQVSEREVDKSEQLTVYAMAVSIIHNVIPPKVSLFGTKFNKSGDVATKAVSSTRTESDFIVFKNRFEQALEIIKKGAFTPASPSDWWCDKAYCGLAFAGNCPYYNSGRKTFHPPIRRSSTAQRKRIIQTNTKEWNDAAR